MRNLFLRIRLCGARKKLRLAFSATLTEQTGILSLFSLACTLTILWVLTVAPTAIAETYHGKVVDAESGEPLEGAVVVVVWHKKPLITMDGPQYFHDAKEVLTDAKGEFSLDGSPATDWNPFTYILEEPWIVIFKPGYQPLTRAYSIALGLKNMNQRLREGAVVRLPKLKTREELRKFSGLGRLGIGSNTPNRKIPNLIRLVNIQSKQAGLDPYPER